jgi:secondary thiamine-phosphate synthase enzyme
MSRSRPLLAHRFAPVRAPRWAWAGPTSGAPPAAAPRPALVSAVRELTFPTTASVAFRDITDDVAAVVDSVGLREGVVTVFSRHTTAAIRIQENESLLLQDLEHFLVRLAPAEASYGHNDFRIRTEHMHPDESPNGHSHCLQFLLGSSESIPVVGGAMQLGTWQRLFLVELDGPRRERTVLVHTLGSSA